MEIAQTMDTFWFIVLILQGIQISRNPVVYVHPAAFQGLRWLRKLTIRSPQLREAPSLQFIGHSLTKLDLSHSKVDFEDGYFKQGYKIQYLYLHNCDLTRIPPLRAIAGSLVKLQLPSNKITTLKPLEGILFARLLNLNLDCNRICDLVPNVLLLPRLNSMYMRKNLLNQIADPSQAPWGMNVTGGARVHLGFNPWHCSATMFWLLQALDRRSTFGGIKFHRNRSNVTLIWINTWYCTTPNQYNGSVIVDGLSTILTLKSRDSPNKSRGMKVVLA